MRDRCACSVVSVVSVAGVVMCGEVERLNVGCGAVQVREMEVERCGEMGSNVRTRDPSTRVLTGCVASACAS